MTANPIQAYARVHLHSSPQRACAQPIPGEAHIATSGTMNKTPSVHFEHFEPVAVGSGDEWGGPKQADTPVDMKSANAPVDLTGPPKPRSERAESAARTWFPFSLVDPCSCPANCAPDEDESKLADIDMKLPVLWKSTR